MRTTQQTPSSTDHRAREGQQSVGNQEVFFRSRGFGRSIDPGTNPAVVVVDFARGFTDPACQLGSTMDEEIVATQLLLEAVRRKAFPVVFTVVAYDDPAKEAGWWFVKMPALANLRTGSRWVELDPRLGARANEKVISKRFASAFFGTELDSYLRSLSVDTVVLVGCTTSGCIRATAVDALQYGYRCMVVADAVADRLPEAHRQSLIDMDAKYADVVPLSDMLEHLKTVGTTESSGDYANGASHSDPSSVTPRR